jgi:hypothetical protein
VRHRAESIGRFHLTDISSTCLDSANVQRTTVEAVAADGRREAPIRRQPVGMATAPEEPIDRLAQLAPWVARLAWIVVAVVGGSAVESAVAGRSTAVAWTAAIGGWTLWAVAALGLAIASVRSLTIVRVVVPLALVATVAAGVGGAPAIDLIALGAPSVVAVAAVMTAELGRRWVQASAYGDEERFPLRLPAGAGLVAIVAWLLWAPAMVAGPLLLAGRSWIAGALVTALAVAGAVLLGPRWHRLTMRWFVLVPAGVVVHDPVVLADTFPLRTAQLASIGLAPADTEAADLTGPAGGYAVEIATTESVTAVFAFTPSEPNGRAIHLRSFLIAPSRPGRALRSARARGLPMA